jgi:hypothetical protein
MKTTTKTLFALSALAGLSFTTAQAVTITWDDGAGNDNWSDGANWVGDPANGPQDGESVVLTTTAQSRLDYAWTIENGASLTSTATALDDELVLQSDSVLTLATGGTMDIAFMRPRFTAGGDFNIYAGASLNTGYYGLGNISADIKYIADATSVTTWSNANIFDVGLDNLTVDLTAYTIVGASSLTLVDYTGGSLSNTFASVTVTDSSGTLTEGVDYTLDYTTGSNITLNVVPEPGTYALIGGMLALGYVMVRRRRA